MLFKIKYLVYNINYLVYIEIKIQHLNKSLNIIINKINNYSL